MLRKTGRGGICRRGFFTSVPEKGAAMAEYHTPRVLLAGTNSGCGKTTLTCALLRALDLYLAD